MRPEKKAGVINCLIIISTIPFKIIGVAVGIGIGIDLENRAFSIPIPMPMPIPIPITTPTPTANGIDSAFYCETVNN